MSFINVLGWPQWLLLLAIPIAITSLYFLKLRRQPLDVPSTLLWQKAIEDLHVNSIWQKLKNNLLLWLQLLFLLLVILACLRPGWQGTQTVSSRNIYLIDNSASMQATDLGKSRLELSKEAASVLVSQMGSDDMAMVVAFSDRTEVVQGFTTDARKLLNAINRIEPTVRVTEFGEVVRSVEGLAKLVSTPSPGAGESGTDLESNVEESAGLTGDHSKTVVHLFSDGGFDLSADEFSKDLSVVYKPIGSDLADNIAILNFAVQRSESRNSVGADDRIEAFARIANFSSNEVTCTASLELNGELVDASQITIPAGREEGVLFTLSNVVSGDLKLTLDHPDALSLDNVATTSIRPPKKVSVLLVTPGHSESVSAQSAGGAVVTDGGPLFAALDTERCREIATVHRVTADFFLTPEYAKMIASGGYDLILFDRCSLPESLAQMPPANTLFIGSAPPDSLQEPARDEDNDASVDIGDTVRSESRWRFGPDVGPLFILDVNRNHPLTRYLEMSSVSILRGRVVTPPEGGVTLMTSNEGPLLSIHHRGPYRDAVLGFSLVSMNEGETGPNTDWGIKRSFPVFIYAVLEELGGGGVDSMATTVRPGQAIPLRLPASEQRIEIVPPGGPPIHLDRLDDSILNFTQTDRQGTYKVRSRTSQDLLESFNVNLFNSRESRLEVAAALQIGDMEVVGTQTEIRARRETWRWWLALGLILLLGEWYLFTRRH